MQTAKERRSEPRIGTSASVVMTPLASVATRLDGTVVNVSARGVRIHVATPLKQLPRVGEIFRVESSKDLMLCEVRHAEVEKSGAALGFQVVHWGDAGELQRLVQNQR